MANSFAYIVLFSWPLVVIWLFRILPRPEALIWSIIGGYLALPFGVGIDPPVLPLLDKTLIPALSAAVMCFLGGAGVQTAPGPAVGTTATAISGAPDGPAAGQSAFTRQRTRRPARTEAAATVPAQTTRLRTPAILVLLVIMLFMTQFLTYLTNRDAYQVGVRFMPGLALYDASSMIQNTLVILIPFLLAQRYLGAPDQQVSLLRVLCIAGLIYSLPTLFEIRMSPQLAHMTYGFLAQAFDQAVRDGGYRPVVFLQHGLWLAIFLAMAALAAFALWRHERAAGRQSFGLLAGLWLTGVLLICHSLGAFVILIGLIPVLLLLPGRAQLLIAALISVITLTYPLLRDTGMIPVETVLNMAASVSQDREGSLKFRLDNEDKLLAHANERSLAGWGGFGRGLIYNAETGADTSVTDGSWIIIMGTSGWLGYLSTYGLLTMPILLLFLRYTSLQVAPATIGLGLMLAANIIDMIANATLTPVTWLIAGALAGRCRFQGTPVAGLPDISRVKSLSRR